MEAIPETHSVHEPTHGHFRSRILATYAAHPLAALRWVESVHSSKYQKLRGRSCPRPTDANRSMQTSRPCSVGLGASLFPQIWKRLPETEVTYDPRIRYTCIREQPNAVAIAVAPKPDADIAAILSLSRRRFPPL